MLKGDCYADKEVTNDLRYGVILFTVLLDLIIAEVDCVWSAIRKIKVR